MVLRHVPIDPDNFAFYGKDVLANFDALPTWKYATPHNIQRDHAAEHDVRRLPRQRRHLPERKGSQAL